MGASGDDEFQLNYSLHHGRFVSWRICEALLARFWEYNDSIFIRPHRVVRAVGNDEKNHVSRLSNETLCCAAKRLLFC